MKRVFAALLLSGLAGWPTVAADICAAPVPPDVASKPARPVLPTKTPCVDAKQGTPGCLGWESFKYNEDVKAYNTQLATWKIAADAYVAKLSAYVNASAEYARCEVKTMQ